MHLDAGRNLFGRGLDLFGSRKVREGLVRDIVRRYDVDGLHVDDYFYPYRIAGKEFPDNGKYLQYGKGMNKDDWRRSIFVTSSMFNAAANLVVST